MMEIQEYIESGTLELYVCGALTDNEMQDVAKIVGQHKQLQKEVAEIELALIKVSESYVSDEINPQILANILRELRGVKATKITSVSKFDQLKKQGNSNFFKPINFALAASVLALVGSVVLNIGLYNNLQESNKELATVQSQYDVFVNEMKVQKANYIQLAGQLEILNDPASKSIRMDGIEGKDGFYAYVVWNSNSTQTYLKTIELPSPPEGMQYQLWALVDGAPVDMGVFDVKNELQELKKINEAQAFAVTLEIEGGMNSPTLEQMYVFGEV